MNMSMIILNRLLLMLMFMIPGFALYKCRVIGDSGVKDMGKLLIYIILPSAIIKSYCLDFSVEKLVGLVISFIAAAVSLTISVIISKGIFGKKYPIEQFGAAFSNAGFMGIPIVQFVLGSEYIYYAAAFVALLNILQWTYGVYVMTGKKAAVSAKNVLLNPVIVSFFCGIILFLLPVRMPAIVTEMLEYYSSINAPLAMIALGTYLAQVNFKELFTEMISYKTSVVRLVVIPAATVLLLYLMPFGSYKLKTVITVLAAAPIGTNVAIYAQVHGGDYKKAVREVVLSTILCIFTMPIILGISNYILQNKR